MVRRATTRPGHPVLCVGGVLPAPAHRIAHSAGRHGMARLRFELRGRRTVLASQHTRAPLQVMKPLWDASGACVVILLSPTGGVVSGDEVELDITVGAGARAVVTTQSATRAYKMEVGRAHQGVRIALEAGSVLEYHPCPLILYGSADLEQDLEARIGTDASLAFSETVMSGRLARGESLAFRRYSTQISVRDDDGLLLHERSAVEPSIGNVSGLGALDGFGCWGSWYLMGSRGLDSNGWEQLRSLADACLPDDGSAIGGISRLRRCGIVGRVMAKRVELITTSFQALGDVATERVLGLAPVVLRRY